MPLSGRLEYAGIEIKIVRGELHKALSLDDVARCLEFEAADDVLPFLGKVGMQGRETYPVQRIDRGAVDMISLAAAVKLTEAVNTPHGRGLEAVLRAEMGATDYDRYSALPEVELGSLVPPARTDQPESSGDVGLPPQL